MKDEDIEEKLKDIEKEIDNAIDQLFVDKIAEEPSPNMMAERIEGKPMREEGAHEIISDKLEDEEVHAGQIEAEGTGTKEEYSKIIDTLQAKIEAFDEWGVTNVAVEKVLTGVGQIKEVFSDNKLIASVVSMITEVLNFMKENPTSHVTELVEFLGNALNAMKKLIQPEVERTENDEVIYDAINTQFSGISSLLTFDIETIELEERFALPGEEKEKQAEMEIGKHETSSEIEEMGINEQSGREVERQKEEETSESEGKGGEEEIINLSMDFLEPAETEKSQITMEETQVVEEKSEGTTAAAAEEEEEEGEGIQPLDVSMVGMKKTTEALSEHAAEEQQEPATEELAVSLEPVTFPSIDKFHELVNELYGTFKQVEKTFFEAHAITELIEKLTIGIEGLKTHTNRLMAFKSTGIPSENELNLLQASVSEINNDFETLSGLLSPSEMKRFQIEEIVPVVVGKKMVGINTQFLKSIYSISQSQEERFLKKGYVSIKGETIPVVNLFEEFSEVSENLNKRLIIVNGENGTNALLADKALKRCFALVPVETSPNGLKTARIFVAEEIPVYEIP